MNRPKRANAGNRMAKVMNESECDDEFYKNCYGGFQETESDNEYQLVEEVADGDDTVDSDFSIDENDDSVNDANGEAGDEKKRAAAPEDDETEAPAKKLKSSTAKKDENEGSTEDGETSVNTTQEDTSENDTTQEETTEDQEKRETTEGQGKKEIDQEKKEDTSAVIEAENGEEK